MAGKVANGTCEIAILPSYYVDAIAEQNGMDFRTGLVAVAIGVGVFFAILIVRRARDR